jgi:hypothetical protein
MYLGRGEHCLLSSVGKIIDAMTEGDLGYSRVKTIGDERIAKEVNFVCVDNRSTIQPPFRFSLS